MNNTTDGANGLPVIAAKDNLTIVGNGDTIERARRAASACSTWLPGRSLTLQNLTLQRRSVAGWALRGGRAGQSITKAP